MANKIIKPLPYRFIVPHQPTSKLLGKMFKDGDKHSVHSSFVKHLFNMYKEKELYDMDYIFNDMNHIPEIRNVYSYIHPEYMNEYHHSPISPALKLIQEVFSNPSIEEPLNHVVIKCLKNVKDKELSEMDKEMNHITLIFQK
jgi:hypothetical protein